MTYFRFFALSIAILFFVACETTPTDTVPAAMTESSFNAALASAKAYHNPYQAERQLSAILSRQDLTRDMRARALFERGSLRRQGAANMTGSIQDFDDMLRISSSHPLANNARIERGYAQEWIKQLEQFRRTGRLQTIAAWFDDAWRLGERDKAAARYRRSGLSPTAEQVTQLTQTGYLCKGSGAGGVLHKYGPPRSDLQTVFWCRGASG